MQNYVISKNKTNFTEKNCGSTLTYIHPLVYGMLARNDVSPVRKSSSFPSSNWNAASLVHESTLSLVLKYLAATKDRNPSYCAFMTPKTQELCLNVMKMPICVEKQIPHFVQSGVCLLKVLSAGFYLYFF